MVRTSGAGSPWNRSLGSSIARADRGTFWAIQKRGIYTGRAATFAPSYPEPGALPQSVYILEPAVAEPGQWVVYYTERGEIYHEGIFDDEDSACDFVYTNLLKPSE